MREKIKSKIENLRFTYLFKLVSQYFVPNKVQQVLFFFVPSHFGELKYFDEMQLGKGSTVRLVVSLVLLRQLRNDDPRGFCITFRLFPR